MDIPISNPGFVFFRDYPVSHFFICSTPATHPLFFFRAYPVSHFLPCYTHRPRSLFTCSHLLTCFSILPPPTNILGNTTYPYTVCFHTWNVPVYIVGKTGFLCMVSARISKKTKNKVCLHNIVQHDVKKSSLCM